MNIVENNLWLGCGLVGLWVFFHLGVYCGCSPLAHGHPSSTCDAGVNDSMQFFKFIDKILKKNKNKNKKKSCE